FNTLLIAVWIKLSSSIKKPFIIVFWSIQLYQKVPTYGLYLSTLVHEFSGIYVRKLSNLYIKH
ncbi:hypothetical protein, partial [Aliarcobacter butzleri]|uniref:hypothetical protein n=1 Tax=Aliarcobacter butzleri TaxID=28197 RepID=UPI001D01DB5A